MPTSVTAGHPALTLISRLHELVSACFTGIWVQTHEPHEAAREITALCRAEGWRLGIWNCDSGVQFPIEQIAIPGVIALHSPEAVEIARALAATKATLSLPNLKRISPQAPAMLVESPTASIVIPPRDVLEVTAGLDGSHDDVVSP